MFFPGTEEIRELQTLTLVQRVGKMDDVRGKVHGGCIEASTSTKQIIMLSEATAPRIERSQVWSDVVLARDRLLSLAAVTLEFARGGDPLSVSVDLQGLRSHCCSKHEQDNHP